MSKESELLKLAKLRQKTRYVGYKTLSDYYDGVNECDYVSPYSKSAHNVGSSVFVILQDWSSDENVPGGTCKDINELGYTPSVNTNKNLIKLLKEHLDLELKDTYTTNFFPFIKMGKMSEYIPPRYMQKAAKEFILPMIEIIKPKIAIALGMKTFNALRQGIGLNNVPNMEEAVKNAFDYKDKGVNVKIFFQAHPSQLSQNIRQSQSISKDCIKEDWSKMLEYV